ncbi:ZEB2-regulated ABC transporter 1 [Lasiodiplodia theobromae]|uniref:ZEB2-regulated ABC transporter 1 n=1 Tax=Lasiodiplodia theobromae TaxID=45133 RepID=A0A5N5D391_9PEZI|nr:ZEB2-regulated ABC transporter 1 [Lasiodiplodia theobromae]
MLVLFILFVTPFIVNYSIAWILFFTAVRSTAAGKKPPSLPYMVPLLGSVVSYVLDPLRFVTTAGANCNPELSPLRIKLFTTEVILVRGTQDIKQLWRQSTCSSSTAIFSFVLRYMFGMHKAAARRYAQDDSGAGPQPFPDSTIAPHNRVDHNTHKALHRFLEGNGLAPLFERFQKRLVQRLDALPVGEDEWVEMDDLVDFLTKELLLPANLDAMCSPAMLQVNPEFPRLFWEYNEWVAWFSKGIPRFLMRRGYAVRDQLLECVKRWHQHAAEQTRRSGVVPEGEEDPFWGSKFFRERRQVLAQVDDYDDDALASEDLASIWGFNTNAVLASMWAVLDVFDDAGLLERVRREAGECVGAGNDGVVDVGKLLQQPVMQAVYAETLRLRVHVYITRYAQRDDLQLGNWEIPRRSTVLVCSTPAHMDETAWNTTRPLDEFWPDRFLVSPGDPHSGPRKRSAAGPKRRDSGVSVSTKDERPVFSLENMAEMWFPYGGGARMCPGRHFAKREIMTTLALLATYFDIEVTADRAAREMQWREFGLGSNETIPFALPYLCPRRTRCSGFLLPPYLCRCCSAVQSWPTITVCTSIMALLLDEQDPSLNPLSDRFSASAWFEALSARRHLPPKQLSVSFRDLDVHGVHDAAEYQRTVGNFPLWVSRSALRRSARVDILKGIDGLVRSGEMLLVLGRPGSGCSTLLKTLAGDTHGITVSPAATLNYHGIPPHLLHTQFRGECTYTAENDVHFPELTVSETLSFAAYAKAPQPSLPGMTRDAYAEYMKNVVVALLGLQSAVNTKLGNEFIRGVSGGERKRVSIAEALIGWSPLQCWDNSTRGLDSATALELIRTLRLFTKSAGSTAIMSIYQGSQHMYDTFDKVTVLYEGHQIFFGSTSRAKQYFEELGFRCPAEATTADFLTSLTNPAEAESLVLGEYKLQAPRTAVEFRERWLCSADRSQLLQEIHSYEAEFPLGGRHLEAFSRMRQHEKSPKLPQHSPYNMALLEQMRLCIRRGFQRLRNNWSVPLSSIIGNVIMAVIVSSIFYNLSQTTDTFNNRGVLIFFATLLNAFMSAFEVLQMWAQRPIVEKQSRFAFYYPFVEAVASMICDLPAKILTSIFFNLTLYFMTNLRRTPGAFFTFYLFSFVGLLTMSMFFRMVGSVSRTIEQTMAPVGIFLANYMIYCGYVIPTRYMHPWLRWVGYINPVSYVFESLMINEFYDRRFECASYVPAGPAYQSVTGNERSCTAVGSVVGQDYVDGGTFIKQNFEYYHSHKWRNLGILFGMMVFFCSIHLLAAQFIQAQRSKGEVLLFRRRHAPKPKTEDDEENAAQNVPAVKREDHQPHDIGLASNIQQQTAIFHWSGVSYDIKVGKETKTLLQDVDGWVKPGTLTALMGATGAGKTTLLDVLASRASAGVVTGQIMVDGRQRDTGFQRKTGYVQQMDLHLPTATVREALNFSALLRQPASVPKHEKLAYVDEVLRLLEMEAYAEAIVGVPGEGLNVEQRKRLTIAVEMAAKPELLLFLDEPTSGLDSQTAWSICMLLRKLASHGQAILCTIHQPSSILFQAFDQLLVLAKPGRTIYFGPIGEGARCVIEYFESNGACRRCEPGDNPAEWMLEIATRSNPTTMTMADKWRDSAQRKAVKKQLREYEETLPSRHADAPVNPEASKTSLREFAVPFSEQLSIVARRCFQQYWRTPSYFWSMFILCTGTAFFIGFSFWLSPNTIQGLQNQLFAIFLVLTMFSNIMQLVMPKFAADRALFESRERQSKTYGWPVFVLSNMLVELPWQSLIAVTVFLTWYFPLTGGAGGENERAGLTFVLIWAFMLFSSTFSHLVVAGIEHAATAIHIAQLLFYLVLIFCGVLVAPAALPGFWLFVHRASPLTYVVGGLVSAVLGGGGRVVECADVEALTVVVPRDLRGNTSCAEYLAAYQSYAGGSVLNPDERGGTCRFCPLASVDAYMESVDIRYEERWRDCGLVFVYVVFNVCATFVVYWLLRVPKRQRLVDRPREDDDGAGAAERGEK